MSEAQPHSVNDAWRFPDHFRFTFLARGQRQMRWLGSLDGFDDGGVIFLIDGVPGDVGWPGGKGDVHDLFAFRDEERQVIAVGSGGLLSEAARQREAEEKCGCEERGLHVALTKKEQRSCGGDGIGQLSLQTIQVTRFRRACQDLLTDPFLNNFQMPRKIQSTHSL
jgi:hypothetical protein